MADIHHLNNHQRHTYETDKCSGCGCDIAKLDAYNEIELTSVDNTVTHIALCDPCYQEAQKYMDI